MAGFLFLTIGQFIYYEIITIRLFGLHKDTEKYQKNLALRREKRD